MSVAGLVLAAGRSARLGQPKQLLPYRGRPLLSWVIDAFATSRAGETWVVLGHEAERVRGEVDLTGTHVIVNERYGEGMSTSLHAGLAALKERADVEAVVIAVGDQPLLDAETIDALLDAHERTGLPVVASDYGDHRGTPLLLHRSAWPLARDIQGDQGARPLLRAYPELVVAIPVPSQAALDVDTWADYESLRDGTGHTRP